MSVSLSKNQAIDLSKPDGSSLTRVTMGLGWDVAKIVKKGLFGTKTVDGESVDLDASAIAYDANKNVVETIWFRKLSGLNGAIVHTGDNRTGDGDGDDEQIKVDLSKVPSNVAYIVFTVNSFTGQTFDTIDNAFCRLVDDTNNKELAKIDLSAKGRHRAVVMSVIERKGSAWSFKSIAEIGTGQVAGDLEPQIRTLI